MTGMQRYRAEKKALGKCGYGGCWEATDGEHVHCPEHREQARLANRRYHREQQIPKLKAKLQQYQQEVGR